MLSPFKFKLKIWFLLGKNFQQKGDHPLTLKCTGLITEQSSSFAQ